VIEADQQDPAAAAAAADIDRKLIALGFDVDDGRGLTLPLGLFDRRPHLGAIRAHMARQAIDDDLLAYRSRRQSDGRSGPAALSRPPVKTVLPAEAVPIG